MAVHELIKIFDKNIVFFLLLLSVISQYVFLHNIVLIHRLDAFLYFDSQNNNTNRILSFNLLNVSNSKCQQRDSNLQPHSLQTNTNHLAKLANLAKWLSVHLRTKWLWIRIALPSLKLQLWRLLWARSSSTFKQTIECGFTMKTDMWHDNNIQSVILSGKFISLKPSLFAKSFQILWFFLDYGLPDLNIWPTTI